MNIAISVYKYGRGGKCVYMLTYTYAGIWETKMRMEKEDRHVGRIVRTIMGTMT